MFKFLPLISIREITDSIYGAIVDPIIESISKVISTALNAVINNVLMPLLKPFFESLVEPILGIIGEVFLAWVHIQTYYMYIAVLKVIDVLEYAFNIFGGISKVSVKNGEPDFLLNIFFTNSGISRVFWAITLLAFAVSLIFGIIAVMRSSIDLDGKRPVGKVLGTIAKTGLTFLIVPFFTIFALNMTNAVVKKTNEIMSMSVGANTPSLGTILFLSTTLEAEERTEEEKSEGQNTTSEKTSAEIAEELKNNNSSGTMVAFTEGVRSEYYLGQKKYWDAAAVMNDFNILQIKTVLGLFMSLFVALMLIICTFVFITRIFEVLLLYIASPFFVATIPLDDGAKFNEWRNMYIAKLLSGFGMLIGMKLYTIIVPIIMSSDLVLSQINFVNMGLKVLFVVGGAFAIYKSNSLLMQIINANAAFGEAATAQAGFGFVMSAKNMGMKALKGSGLMSPSRGHGNTQKPALSGGNRNPNLNTFNRTNVSKGITRNNNVTIGAHRANSNKIEIGSHRKNFDSTGNASNNITIGAHRANSSNTWKKGEASGGTRNPNVTIGSHGSRTTWKNSETPNGTRNGNITMGSSARTTASQTPNTWTNGVINKSSSGSDTSTNKQSSTGNKNNSKSTWKKATPSGKKDESNKY